jgi:hypothetical protein
MKKPSCSNTDPIEKQIERALRPGEFIHDRACFSFVSGLDPVVSPRCVREGDAKWHGAGTAARGTTAEASPSG